MMKQDFPEVRHCFDPFHVRKNLKKRLRALGKRTNFGLVNAWMQKILNHMFFACEECRGDKDKLVHIWKSCKLHVINDHSKCLHGSLTPAEQKRKAWFDKTSSQYKVRISLPKLFLGFDLRSTAPPHKL